MNDDNSREWIFQLNIVGLTLSLFASSYIGQHLALLLPVSGLPRILLHYLGELVLTAVAFGYAMWRAFGASEPQRGRVDWLKRSAVWLYVSLGAVMVNLVLLTVLPDAGQVVVLAASPSELLRLTGEYPTYFRDPMPLQAALEAELRRLLLTEIEELGVATEGFSGDEVISRRGLPGDSRLRPVPGGPSHKMLAWGCS